MPFHRVLVVDDDDDVRAFIRGVLHDAGYEVVDVDDGAEALSFVARAGASLVLLDLRMQDVSGWEVAGTLRRTRPTVPVVIVSGAEAKDVPWELPHLRKPFSAHDLLAMVRKHCASPMAGVAVGPPSARDPGYSSGS